RPDVRRRLLARRGEGLAGLGRGLLARRLGRRLLVRGVVVGRVVVGRLLGRRLLVGRLVVGRVVVGRLLGRRQRLGVLRRSALEEPLDDAERPLVPRDAVRDACGADAAAVRQIPVVGLAERLLVREPRREAEQALRLRDVYERVAVGRTVVPLGERREARELERA